MANMLTWLFQLLFLPCTLAIANVRKFLHMQNEGTSWVAIHHLELLPLLYTELDVSMTLQCGIGALWLGIILMIFIVTSHHSPAHTLSCYAGLNLCLPEKLSQKPL